MLSTTLTNVGTAHADAQVSSRYALGFGSTMGELPREFLFENVLRLEILFGAPGDEHARIGPALDLRTADYDTAEAAIGAAVLLPIARGYPFILTAALGYAKRRDPVKDGAFLLGTLAWGYRSYNFHSRYQIGLHVFVSARVHMDDYSHWEITGGIEIDLQGMIGIPAMFVINAFRGGAPDEPDEPDESDEPETYEPYERSSDEASDDGNSDAETE